MGKNKSSKSDGAGGSSRMEMSQNMHTDSKNVPQGAGKKKTPK